jgi:regulatory protein
VPEQREALGLALQALGSKERSIAELGSWLRKRGVAEDETIAVIDHLIETEVLDDARFARRYAEDKRELAGWGSERIHAALIERGVSHADAEAALGGEAAESELERAVTLLAQRARPLDTDRDRNSALGFLARRGYDSETAYEAIRGAQHLQ